jgi:RimJ/RimL family protein N-acetyltransferase
MEIIDYDKNKMSDSVLKLFKEIYPEWPMEDLQRVIYDENIPLHLTTKLAIVNNRVVGQANVFRLQHNKNIANLGTHVHPKFQKKGIGTKLAYEVLKEAKLHGIKGVVIQTEKDNKVELRVAKKLGFSEVPQKFIQENKDSLKFCRMKNGMILYKDI